MRIPLSRNLSRDTRDIIGHLEIPEQTADEIAEMMRKGLRFELTACVTDDGGKAKLMLVSIIGIKAQEVAG